MAKRKIKIDKPTRQERQTYMESTIVVILFILVVLSFVLAGVGLSMPSSSINISNVLLNNMLMVFLIAEVLIVILLLHRIYNKTS